MLKELKCVALNIKCNCCSLKVDSRCFRALHLTLVKEVWPLSPSLKLLAGHLYIGFCSYLSTKDIYQPRVDITSHASYQTLPEQFNTPYQKVGMSPRTFFLTVLALVLLNDGHCFSVQLLSKVTRGFTHCIRLPASRNNVPHHITMFPDSIIYSKTAWL